MTAHRQDVSRTRAPSSPSLSSARALAPLALLLLVASVLLLADLGGPRLWEDEADTALFTRSIVRHGLPLAWDGRTFVDSDDGLRVVPRALGQPLVMVGTPWLPYYAAAASFALFGESEWAARLPFALAAIATIAALYAFVFRATGCTRAAFAACAVLLASTQFLLYGREARSYAPNMLLSVGVLWGFLRLGERRRDPWLAIAAVLLFHVQILPAVIALAACGAVALLRADDRSRLRPLLARAPFVAAATLPWFALSWAATGANWSPLASAGELGPRVGQLAVESAIAIPLVGWAVGFPLVRGRLRAGDRRLLALCGAWLAAFVVATTLVLSQPLLEVVGLRYVCAVLPIAAAVTGVLVARAGEGRPPLYAALLLLFAATPLAGPTLPWLAIGTSHRAHGVLWQAPQGRAGDFLNTTWLAFVRGLGARDPGALGSIVERLDRDAGRDDVVLTNFGWDALYWYADRPLGMRIATDAPVRRAAQRMGLPESVFDYDHAAWLVWRGDDEAFLGYPLTLLQWRLPQVRTALAARGARLEEVAAFPETLWENRPELYWHRFPESGHPFASDATEPHFAPARVFRVRWGD
jgi:4-amino-4-deoxy-L-arabinose transferase-like glycosyltransferase